MFRNVLDAVVLLTIGWKIMQVATQKSRLKNKCKPNDMNQNIERQAGHGSNTMLAEVPVRIQRSRQSKQVSPNGLPIAYVGRPCYGQDLSLIAQT